MEEIDKVFGPYSHSEGNGRKIVVIQYVSGRKKSTAYARHLMEQHLGRELGPDETVDHIDEDPSNDCLSNLQILTREDNTRKSSFKGGISMTTFLCAWCGGEGEQATADHDKNRESGHAGPFCGRSCAGRYSAAVQNGGVSELV